MRVPIRSASVTTHNRPEETRPALEAILLEAASRGVKIYLDAEERSKHPWVTSGEAVLSGELGEVDVDLCISLGGDGTILRGLRVYAGSQTPVFAVNFGEIGFLATVEQSQLQLGLEAALSGSLEVLSLPVLSVKVNGLQLSAVNDVSIHRSPDRRVANLAYGVDQNEVGRVRCDGLVASTPAGSTGYNLANGGPVLAWGVEGYAVSFIAPHSLTARALVVAPEDVLKVTNLALEDSVELFIDGRRATEIAAESSVEIHFCPNLARLAKLPSGSFYEQLSEKFGRLAS